MKKLILPLLLSAVLADSSGAVTLTFDQPPVSGQRGYGDGDAYEEQGFIWTTISDSGSLGAIIRFNPASSSALPNNGTIHFGATLFSNPKMSLALLGQSFSLESIDFARYSDFSSTRSVTIQGNYVAGGTVAETISIGSEFSTYSLPSSWTGLGSIEFLSTGMAWDNVKVSVVPEPTASLLFAVTLIVGVLQRRRTE